ncbi:YerC/YecD family TrpR-related protein [Erysipelothrix anatis]|uniref:YerC/YecD family TrpR-related protein n=1 Tax=Erysipelothrix anatis TaxID=2683713 RepID=UPI0013577667|nr:YerC/YecD family TrpR-related protein [Erysipelothrix anatis]
MVFEDNEKFNELVNVLASLDNETDVRNFLIDLCTIKELLDFSERLFVAKLLHENQTYDAISKQTKMSTATIARVNKALNYGTGGYQKVLNPKSNTSK